MEKESKVVSLAGAKSKDNSKDSAKDTKQTNATQSFEPVYCSFCGRPNHMVAKMVQGPGVNICSECTMIAVQYLILDDRMPSGEAQKILDLFWSKV